MYFFIRNMVFFEGILRWYPTVLPLRSCEKLKKNTNPFRRWWVPSWGSRQPGPATWRGVWWRWPWSSTGPGVGDHRVRRPRRLPRRRQWCDVADASASGGVCGSARETPGRGDGGASSKPQDHWTSPPRGRPRSWTPGSPRLRSGSYWNDIIRRFSWTRSWSFLLVS